MLLLETRTLLRAATTGLSLAVLALQANAQSLSDQPVTSTPFVASITTGEVIGSEQVRRVKIAVGTNEFAFVLPRGLNLKVDASRPERLTISSMDSSYFVTIRLLGSSLEGIGESELSTIFKNILLTQYQGANSFEEYSESADGSAGPAFDGTWYVGGTIQRTLRVAFIPTKAGTMEVALIADPKMATEAKSAMSSVLMTMRSNKDGKIEHLVLTDKT